MRFFKNILASMLGFWLALIIFIVLIFIGVAFFAADGVPKIEESSVLDLDFKGNLKDYVSTEEDVVANLLNLNEEIGFNQVIKSIQIAKDDSKIKAISLGKMPTGISWAQLTELRNELLKFKEAGKPIRAYNDFYQQGGYYLASVADEIVLSPLGSVDLVGLHSETLFFKDLQEKYGFKMEVIRHGKYKSAVEPYLYNEMSDENREQISALINSLWSQVDTALSESRSFNVENAVNEMQGSIAEEALENNIVDRLAYKDDFKSAHMDSFEEEISFVKIEDYIQTQLATPVLGDNDSKVAVIYAQGTIRYAEGDQDTIGQDLMIKAFKEAVEDESVKAIVLRVNSPGGSALSSDLIWNAVTKAKASKPVVVSMANVAASGGYYIACNANTIFAEPTTITGSIGVFGVIPNASEIAKENGIHAEMVSTHDNEARYSLVQPLQPKLRASIKKSIENTYDIFVKRVAEGRKMTTAAVDSIAQGRVWTGAQAREVGLVDELGGLTEAIAHAATLAEIESYDIKELPKYEMDFQNLLGPGSFIKLLDSDNIAASPLKRELKRNAAAIESLLEMEGVQARLPFALQID